MSGCDVWLCAGIAYEIMMMPAGDASRVTFRVMADPFYADLEQAWSSGIIAACHAVDPGSIPGACIFVPHDLAPAACLSARGVAPHGKVLRVRGNDSRG